jgi:hypothetical protein
MTELERLEVRVVSGRLGRREGEGSDDEQDGDSKGDEGKRLLCSLVFDE